MKRLKGGKRFSRRAAVITQAAIFGSAVGLGVAALAVDTGLMFASKQELQSAADSAALAAASKLGSTTNAEALAITEAGAFTNLNEVANMNADLVDSDVVFGHATLNGTKYAFQANQQPYDAVRVTVRRDATVADGPISLVFGKALGLANTSIQASATAMIVPRDIALVIDLSGSMNDDSELRHYKDFPSETEGTRDGVQINLEDVWLAMPCEKGNNGVGNGIDPQPPGNPQNYNDQPGTGPGSPNSQGGNPSPGAEPSGPDDCTGPRWGWMTGFGDEIILDQYSPANDSGLYYIPRYSTTTQADIVNNLTESGYSAGERTALLSGQYDGNFTLYSNRVRVLLGLAGWRSKKTGGKYNGGPGNQDNKVDTKELTQEVNWNFDGGSWSDYVSYASSTSSQMYNTDSSFRYRYGIKTVMNYLLEKQASNSKTPDLANTPEQPLRSVKDAVQTLIDTVVEMESDDHGSLEVFATTGMHEIDLTVPENGEVLADLLQDVPDTLNQRQAGHYDSTTCIGCGLEKAVQELTSARARSAASKVIVLLSDGKPNVGGGGSSPENYALDQAEDAADQKMTIYTIGVGGDANDGFLEDIAAIGGGQYFFADNAPDPETGIPMYVEQLQEIFQTIGGKRPVRLIQ